jgi:alternate signal-mediated exported protein
MNNKLVKGSLAGVAALALAAGTTTFASWSDFHVTADNNVGADVLALTVDPAVSVPFDDIKLAPGTRRDMAFYVASRNGTTIPAATLKMTIKDLVGTENGCDSNSEAYTESNGAVSDKTASGAPCSDTTGPGQFIRQAAYTVQAVKASNPSSCTTSTEMPTVQSYARLSTMRNVAVDLLDGGTLAGNEGVCVLANIFLPNDSGQVGWTADNASQGDRATFKIRFDLQQVPVINES